MKGVRIMVYIAHWYDQNDTVDDPTPITANGKAEAERIAYTHYNGNPPKPMLWLEEKG